MVLATPVEKYLKLQMIQLRSDPFNIWSILIDKTMNRYPGELYGFSPGDRILQLIKIIISKYLQPQEKAGFS